MSEKQGNVTVARNAGARRFEAEVDGNEAILEYYLEGKSIVFIHTGVPEEIEGRGVGGALAQAGLDYARQEHLTVVPLCPFVEEYIRKHPDQIALVEPHYRKRLYPESEHV